MLKVRCQRKATMMEIQQRMVATQIMKSFLSGRGIHRLNHRLNHRDLGCSKYMPCLFQLQWWGFSLNVLFVYIRFEMVLKFKFNAVWMLFIRPTLLRVANHFWPELRVPNHSRMERATKDPWVMKKTLVDWLGKYTSWVTGDYELTHIRETYQTKSGWWFQPLWKILVSWDDYSQYNIRTNKKCSKPPTRSSTIHINPYLCVRSSPIIFQRGMFKNYVFPSAILRGAALGAVPVTSGYKTAKSHRAS
jgi:hypothetical protein